MSSKQQDVDISNISPVLFMTLDGESMSFFLRPGPVKRNLQPLITSGGGMVCSVQQPGAILLIDPQTRGNIPESTAHWYVSTQFIYDCIEKNEQLNVEDYRLNSEVVPRQSSRLKNNKDASSVLCEGRVAYTPEEDAAILSYISKHKTEIGGNRLWQEMERQRVTSHTWQSMKYRYRAQLKKRLKVEEVKTEEQTEEEDNQETDIQKPSGEDAAPPQTHSAAAESPQTHSGAAEPPQTHSAAAAEPPQTHAAAAEPPQTHSAAAEPPQTHSAAEPPQTHSAAAEPPQTHSAAAEPPQTHSGAVEPAQTHSGAAETPQTHSTESDLTQIDVQLAPTESTQTEDVEAKSSSTTQPDGPCLDPQTDAPLTPAEATEPATTEPQPIISPQKESVPESDPLQPLPDSPTPKKPTVRQTAATQLEQPQRRSTRRQLKLDASSPEPYGKKLRSSSTAAEKSSPQPAKKVKSSVKPAAQTHTTTDEPPSKKAREKSVTAATAEGQHKESEEATVSETPHPVEECNPVPQNEGKKKEKRRLGILELATKEFEDESESSEDEPPDLPNPTERAAPPPTSTEPPVPPAVAAVVPAPTQSNLDPGPSRQENSQIQIQAPGSNCEPETGCTEAPISEPAANEAVHVASRAHLFIFDHESQEEESLSLIGECTAARSKPQPLANKDAPPSLTQVQLEEDKQRITELMRQTNQDLVCVTKALLRTSGDFSAAANILLNPSLISGPFWNRYDDSLLLSTDPGVRQQLQKKYGEEGVAKRIVFLEMEG